MPGNVWLCLDVGHCYGLTDPAEFTAAHFRRIAIFHLRDETRSASGKVVYSEPGEGGINLKGIVRSAPEQQLGGLAGSGGRAILSQAHAEPRIGNAKVASILEAAHGRITPSRQNLCYERWMCQWHLGLRRLDAAFVIVLAFISRRRQAAAVQGASHIFMYSAEPKAQGNLRCN